MANSVETLYTARMGMISISTPNSALDGSGAISTIITGGSNGTLVKTLFIKAQSDTSEGMIRVFIKRNGTSTYVLLSEVYVSPVLRSGDVLSFYKVMSINYMLSNGDELAVSTEAGDTFNVIAECLDITYGTTTTYIDTSVQYTSTVGTATISTANTNLDGTGATEQVIIAGTGGGGDMGCVIKSLFIKAQASTDIGMVRFYLQAPGGSKYLFFEVLIPNSSQAANIPTLGVNAIDGGSICLPLEYSIWASTEVTNSFNIISQGSNWESV